MNIKGFALQHGKQSSKEDNAILQYCIMNRVPYKFCRKPEDRPDQFIPSGTVEWCEKFLTTDKKMPDYFPDFVKDRLYRKVWKTDKWPTEAGIFIKPADKHKRFTGFITLGGYKKKKKGPYWCSEVVKFINEWRYYVADGKILIGEWYWGDEVAEPDAPVLDIKIPETFCGTLDFGSLPGGEIALIESHPPYACGWYGKKHELYIEWLAKGWKYLTER
jgi:hypothetical protein